MLHKLTDENGDSYVVGKGLKVRDRGFEKISIEQWAKDVPEPASDYHDELRLPKRATSKCAGYDFFAPYTFILQPNQDMKIPTGIKAYMMDDERLSIYPRSGLGFKYFVRLANTVGIVDSDYYDNKTNEGHIWIKVRNEGNVPLAVNKGDGFAQGIFEKYLLADGDDFTGNERVGGLGST